MATFQTLKETDDQDIAIENGDLVLITDKDAVRQQLETNYRLSKNNWFLNLDEGLNYYDNENGIIGGKGLSEENRSDLIITGAETIGIRELININFTIDGDGVLNIPITFTTIFSTDEDKTTVRI